MFFITQTILFYSLSTFNSSFNIKIFNSTISQLSLVSLAIVNTIASIKR